MKLFCFLVSAGALSVALSACGSAADPAPPTCTLAHDVVVATSDYASSGVTALRLSDGKRESRFGVDLGKDPALAVSRGRLFLLARDQDLAFELDPTCGAPVAKIGLHDEGASGVQNPQDLAVDSAGRMWVPRFNDGSLLVLEGGAHTTVPLGAYDVDGNPQPASVRIVRTSRGERAFVSLERLDRDLVSRRASAVLELDTATRAPVHAHPLLGKNPFGAMVEHEDGLYLAEPGNFDANDEADAGIERFDPETGTSRMILGERELGGSVAEIAFAGPCLVAIVADPTKDVNATSLVLADTRGTPRVTARGDTTLRTSGYDLQGLFVRGDTLFVGDRRARGDGSYEVHGFRITDTCTLTRDTSLPPLTLPQKPVALRSVLQNTR